MSLEMGLLVIRLTIGLVIAAHGAQKLFGWFSGPGIAGTEKMMSNLHLEPARFWAYVGALNEFVGGLFTAAGFLMPLGPLMIIANMLIAVTFVHWSKGFWNAQGGYEFPVVLGLAALGWSVTGT